MTTWISRPLCRLRVRILFYEFLCCIYACLKAYYVYVWVLLVNDTKYLKNPSLKILYLTAKLRVEGCFVILWVLIVAFMCFYLSKDLIIWVLWNMSLNIWGIAPNPKYMAMSIEGFDCACCSLWVQRLDKDIGALILLMLMFWSLNL